MKKIFYILLFSFCTITFSTSNTLDNITFNRKSMNLIFSENVKDSDYSVKYDSSTYLLIIDLNTQIDLKKIKTTIKPDNNEYIDTVLVIQEIKVKQESNNKDTDEDEVDKILKSLINDNEKPININTNKNEDTTSEEKKTSLFVYLKKDSDYNIDFDKNNIVVSFKNITPKVKNKKTIVIDPGHGGKDSGGQGNGLNEKDLALAVGLRLKKLLEVDYNVIITRDRDIFIPLTERAAIGNRVNADLFVSIHLNASNKETSNGAEVFYFSKNATAYAAEIAKFENSFDKASTEAIESSRFLLNDITYHSNQVLSANLAKKVLDNIISEFNQTRRGIFGANFAVLRGSKSPAILIELGFLTNKKESAIYADEINQYIVAQSISEAIKEYLNNLGE